MSDNQAFTALLSSPAAFVASVPHLLGFIPSESLVLTWLRAGEIVVTQRVDVEGLTVPDDVCSGPLRLAPDSVVAAVFSDTPVDADQMSEFVDALETEGVAVKDFIWVRHGQWGSLLCADPACCPPEGRPVDASLAVEFIGRGSAPVASRELLFLEVAPVGVTPAVPVPSEGLEEWRDEMIALVMGLPDEPEASALVQAGSALRDVRVRDTVLYDIAGLDEVGVARQRMLVARVAQAMRPEDAAPALSVAGVLAWLMGDGARARVAVDTALACEPKYSLAGLIHAALAGGLPPQAWQESMQALTRDDCRVGSGSGK